MALALKLVLQGYGGVGKSALVFNFIQDIFLEEFDSTIEEIYRKQVMVDGEAYILEIFDSAVSGVAFLRRDRVNLHQHGFIFVFSIICRISFDYVGELYDYVKRVLDSSIPIILVGNKCDLVNERAVSEEEAKEMAAAIGAIYIETSTKESKNVEECFFTLVRDIRAKSPVQFQQHRARKH